MSEASIRALMVEMGRRLWERELIGACEGNLSVRLDSDRILCTPSGLSKGHLRVGDLVVIRPDGTPVHGGTPSSEIKLHLRCYAKREDCVAVVHAHPPVATALTLVGETIPSGVMPEADLVLGPVPLVPYSTPGTEEVPDRLEPFLADHKTFLLSHHGAATLGRDLPDACDRMESLERVARVLWLARGLGSISPLSPADASVLEAAGLHGRLG